MTLSYAHACATLKRLLEEKVDIEMDVGSKENPATLNIISFKEEWWVWLSTPDLSVEQVYPHGVKIELKEAKFGTPDDTIISTRWILEINKSSDDNGHRLSMDVYVDEGHDLFGPEVFE